MSAAFHGENPEVVRSLPQSLGRYLLVDQIGRGGMAELYLALRESSLDVPKQVVVKEMRRDLGSLDVFTDMLVAEAKLASQLNHRNIVQVLDLGRADGRVFIVMEYVEGYDLNRLLRELSVHRIPLPGELALFIVRQVLAALEYAHGFTDEAGVPLGIVHRDVSPSNLLISFEGRVCLCDFGIAKATELLGQPGDAVRRRAEESSRVAGKSAYMSPEQALGLETDARADVFSVGILLWELCAGRRMYRGSEDEILDQARRGAVPELPDRGLPAFDDLRVIVQRALHPDVSQRYRSAVEMLAALDRYCEAAGLAASEAAFGRFLQRSFAEQIQQLRERRAQAVAVARASGRTRKVHSGYRRVVLQEGTDGGPPSSPPAPPMPTSEASPARESNPSLETPKHQGWRHPPRTSPADMVVSRRLRDRSGYVDDTIDAEGHRSSTWLWMIATFVLAAAAALWWRL